MKKGLIISMLFLPFALCACNTQMYEVSEKDDGISELIVTKKTMTLSVGESDVLSAIATVEGEQPTYTFSVTGNQSAIQISAPYDNNGFKSVLVTALEKGTANVVVNAGNHFAMCEVTVGGGGTTVIPVDSVSLSTTSKTAYVVDGQPSEFELSATVLPQNATNKTVTWSSTDSTIASITSQGEIASIKCLREGTATIKAKAGNKEDSCIVTVKEKSESDELEITLDKSTASVKEGESLQLHSDVNKQATITWQSDKPAIASVDNNGLVKGLTTGSATISATAVTPDGKETDTASCIVNVTSEGGSDYEKEIALWSKPGHLYLHYIREDGNYDPWAVWMWQKLPNGLEGSLWGATNCPSTVTSMTDHWMTNSEVGKAGNQVYSDQYGQICDIDLTREDIVDGKEGELSPIIQDWNNLAKARIGFLIVDQSKMGGGSHWTSDGGIEAYIKQLDQKFPEGKDSYLHIYCVSGAVSSFTYSSGQGSKPNPTATDTTGQYRSVNDIQNLKQDLFKAGVPTSETFLEDKPGTGYQIFVPSYADSDGDGMGDLRGIINKLDYIQDLGVKVLWLTPIQESDSYHGYDVTDYYKIDSKFGTLEDYQELLFKAHQKGMKVLMDMVINHTSKNNVLFTKSQRAETEVVNGKTINYRDMYLWKFEGDKVREWDGVEPATNEPATYINVNVEDSSDWYRDGASKYFYFGKFGSGMAELNYSSQATRDYMTDMCKYWLSFGLDGFRLDAIKHIYLAAELDPVTASAYANDNITYDVGYKVAYDEQIGDYTTTKNDYTYDRDLNVMFWKQFAGTIKSAYPNCFLVGENFDGWNERVSHFYESMESQFDFSTYYHLNELEPNSVGQDIKTTLSYNKVKRTNHINGAFTSNHDIARLLNHAGANGDASHTSEISSANKILANNRARYFAAATILTPGVSWIYYGDELGMSGNQKDKVTDSKGRLVDDHGNNIDRWYRQPMRWGNEQGKDNVPIYIFSGLEVNWDLYNRELPVASAQQADPTSMFNFFKAACTVKNDSRYPTYGYVDWAGTCGAVSQSIAMQISDGSRKARVFINVTDSPISIPAMDRGELIGSSYGGTDSEVPAYGFVVVKA